MKNLSRDEMKKVMGGNASLICACNSNYDCDCGSYDHCSRIPGTACLDCNNGQFCAG